MDTLTYDFDAQTTRGERPDGPVPGGRWNVIVQDLIPKTSKKGNPYTQIVFEVIGGDFTNATDDKARWEGARIWCNKPWALGWLLEATGYVTTDPATGKKVGSAKREQLIEYPVVIDLVDSEYGGKAQNEVTAIWAEEAVPAADLADIPFDMGATPPARSFAALADDAPLF